MNSLSISIDEFLQLSSTDFTGYLVDIHHVQHSSLTSRQTFAWKKEYEDLQRELKGLSGRIVFEYDIPNLNKVVDVILLTNGKIFVIEFKANSESYSKIAIKQIEGYAYRLKYYHSRSNDKWVVPILIATDSGVVKNHYPCSKEELDKLEDMVYPVIKCNSTNLRSEIDRVNEILPETQDNEWADNWSDGIYKVSPTIIDAARNVWKQNNVRDFKFCESSSETRLAAEDYIINTIVKEAKENRKKAICFVTGTPGAGKTLVGLNISVRLQGEASLLSGNGPLVQVITTALQRDLTKNKKRLICCKDNISVESIIRSAYGYKKEIFAKRLEYIQGGTVRLKKGAEQSTQHVIIFDEAQRTWNKQKLISPGHAGRQPWQEEAFPFSEAGLLLWDMNIRDWGVIVCLVGGGQIINTGESGICEWLQSIKENDDLSAWDIYISNELRSKNYESKDERLESVESYINYFKSKGRLIENSSLNLTACQRSNRTDKVSDFIEELLECNCDQASNLYESFKDKYRIYLTRDIELAKKKLRERCADITPLGYRDGKDDEEIRMGMLMSSKAARLRPLGYNVIKVSEFLKKIPNWFLDSGEYVGSSNFLEIAMNEFFVQGLELDLAAVIWDADFRYNPKNNTWNFYAFNGKEWSEIKRNDVTHETKRQYMMNAYRVLLTRARSGMVIIVPKGDPEDPTRTPAYYDSTYEYLKEIGIKEI